MQQTSALYKQILTGNHYKETRVSIGDSSLLVDNRGDYITFGGNRILVGTSGPDNGYGMDILASVDTSGSIFSCDDLTVGNVVSRECNIKMLKPYGTINGLDRIGIYTRLVSSSDKLYSEWLPQGVFLLIP